MKRSLLIALFSAALVILADSSALARYPGGGGPGFGGGRPVRGGAFVGGGWGVAQSTIWDLYLSGQVPIPPYFALNPPVYYSYPVPRTYGYSPWAYPGTVRTPDIVCDAQPVEIINPYVPSSSQTPAEPPADQTTQAATPQPLVIENPFVKSSRVLNASVEL